MSFHNYNRTHLYNVTTERVIRRILRLKRSWCFWTKTYWVYEYALYECIGEHPEYFGMFAFTEEEYTGFKKKFKSREEAERWIKSESF
jgi:hypothetical protein